MSENILLSELLKNGKPRKISKSGFRPLQMYTLNTVGDGLWRFRPLLFKIGRLVPVLERFALAISRVIKEEKEKKILSWSQCATCENLGRNNLIGNILFVVAAKVYYNTGENKGGPTHEKRHTIPYGYENMGEGEGGPTHEKRHTIPWAYPYATLCQKNILSNPPENGDPRVIPIDPPVKTCEDYKEIRYDLLSP